MELNLNQAMATAGLVILGVSANLMGCDPTLMWGAMVAVAGIAGYSLADKTKK